MTRAEALQEIIAAVNPRHALDEHTVIAECADLDSLGLFNAYLAPAQLNYAAISTCVSGAQ